MKIIIADTAISRVPKSWLSDPKIARYFTKYNRRPLIDASKHQHLLKNTSYKGHKDRPDILHFGLLTILGYANLIQNLEIEFFIDKDNWFQISKETNLPRSQRRFYGIMEQVLSNNYKSPYITKVDEKHLDPSNVIYFSSTGRNLQTSDLESNNFVFGGFAHGNYRSLSPPKVSTIRLHPSKLDLWTSLSLFINKYIEFHDYKN